PAILDGEIDNRSPWARKHVGTLRQFYARAPHLNQYLPALEEMLERRWSLLVELDLAVTELICRWLGLARPTLRASALGIAGKQSGRLPALLPPTGVPRYPSGHSANAYLDTDPSPRPRAD